MRRKPKLDTSHKGISEKKLAASYENLKKAIEANKARRVFGIWRCRVCNTERPATANQLKQTYCSRQCMASDYVTRLANEDNPNYRDASKRVCARCGSVYRSYLKTRKYCSRGCYEGNDGMKRHGTRKDANHNECMEAIRMGCQCVHDLSDVGRGVPDGVAWICGAWRLFDIKNPQTAYGRAGLNDRQKKWHSEFGGPIYLIYSREDAINFAAGKLDQVKIHGTREVIDASKASEPPYVHRVSTPEEAEDCINGNEQKYRRYLHHSS